MDINTANKYALKWVDIAIEEINNSRNLKGYKSETIQRAIKQVTEFTEYATNKLKRNIKNVPKSIGLTNEICDSIERLMSCNSCQCSQCHMSCVLHACCYCHQSLFLKLCDGKYIVYVKHKDLNWIKYVSLKALTVLALVVDIVTGIEVLLLTDLKTQRKYLFIYNRSEDSLYPLKDKSLQKEIFQVLQPLFNT